MGRRLGILGSFVIVAALVAAVTCPPVRAGAAPGADTLSSAAQAQDKGAPQSREWKRVRMGDFEAVGNASAGDMAKMLSGLACFRGAFVSMFPSLRLASPVPTVTLLFKDAAAFDRFKPRDEKGRREENVGGYFISDDDVNLMVLPVQAWGDAGMAIVFHEYAHYLTSLNMARLPTWLSEGISEFYSTFEPEGDQKGGVVGRAPVWRLRVLRSSTLLPLDQMLGNDSAGKLVRDRGTVGLFYAQAWALVHYLTLAREGKEQHRISNYLEAVRGGMAIEPAFRQTFGTTFRGMQDELERYLRRPAIPAIRVSERRDVAEAKPVVEILSEAEAQSLQGDLLARLGASDDAEKYLRKAVELEPAQASASLALGQVRLRQKRYTEALELVQPMTDGPSASFRAFLLLGAIHDAMEQSEQALEVYRKATRANAASTAGWARLCYLAASLGKTDESDQALARLMAMRPTTDWLQGRAYEEFHHGQFAAVSRDAAAFIAQAGPASESAPYMAFLAAISDWHLERAADASAVLQQVQPSVAPETWTARVMGFMQDRLAADALLSKAKDNEERTEAHAYIGIRAAMAGHRDEALQHLQWVRDRGTKSYYEYRLAETELKRLGAEPAPAKR